MTSDQPPPPIAVVVTTYRRRELLPLVIDPLLRDAALGELVVVIDSSRDGSLELLTERARLDSRITVIFNERNRGPHESRAIGVRATTLDVVLLLDDDVLPAEGLVTGHASEHSRQPGAVVVGYMPTRLPRRRGAGDFGRFVYDSWYQAQCDEYERDPATTLAQLWGGNVSLPRQAFLTAMAGSVFEARHQDRDLGLRLRAQGLEGRFVRALVADHRHDRPATAFVDEGVPVGRGMHLLHEKWPDIVPAADFDVRSRAGRLKSWVAASPRRLKAATRALVAAATAAGALRLWPLETRLGLLARHLAFRAGWSGADHPVPD